VPPLPPPPPPPPSRSVSSVELTTLCTDVQLVILDHLHLVDRLCLGLTCKRMARLVLLSTRLAPTDGTPFVDNPIGHQSSYDLLPRLMHGWMPKDRFRFCAWCGKIYTRSPEFWERRGMLPKPLVWSPRLSVPKHEWIVMSKKAKYRWLIQRWRDAQTEDGSGARCVPCGVKPNSKLWYEMVHCPACTATTLAHARPGRPSPLRYSWIETVCMEACEAVSWYAAAAFEAVGGAVSGLLRSAVSQLQMAVRKGRRIFTLTA
jgi:hypothetical protein